jgi:hypothetical protein
MRFYHILLLLLFLSPKLESTPNSPWENELKKPFNEINVENLRAALNPPAEPSFWDRIRGNKPSNETIPVDLKAKSESDPLAHFIESCTQDNNIIWNVENRKKIKKICQLLLKHGSDINSQISLNSLLVHTIKEDRLEIADILLKLGADVNNPNSWNGALRTAVFYSDMIEDLKKGSVPYKLVKHGATEVSCKNGNMRPTPECLFTLFALQKVFLTKENNLLKAEIETLRAAQEKSAQNENPNSGNSNVEESSAA